jgi:hypothetical protein
VLESFARQWPKMDALEIEFRRWQGQPLVATKLTASGRREVRIAGMFFMQPVLVLRGSSRMVVLPKVPGTGETAVLFEPVDGGATEVRFAGLGYALASLVAVPLASGPLREVRVAAGGPDGGPQMVNVAMLMEAGGRRGDPRRLIVFQDVRRVRRSREAFEVRSETLHEEQTFHYLTPDRRYTYHRRKGPDER